MKVCFIVPKKYWFLSKEYSDFYLILAHQVANEDPSMFRDKYIILDNGAYELGQSVDYVTFQKAIENIQPQEVILPDKRFDGEATVALSRGFLNNYYDKRFSYMGCVQGKNIEDWWDCFIAFYTDKRISIIGITDVPANVSPSLSDFLCAIHNKQSRVFDRVGGVFEIIQNHSNKPIHILGSIDPVELKYLSRLKNVIRTDSKIAFWNGVNGDGFTYNGLKPGSGKKEEMAWLFENSKLYEQNKDIILSNIRIFAKLARSKEDEKNY